MDRVAPHDGCVDWNPTDKAPKINMFMSHPTMGAWIEITDGIFGSGTEKASHPTMGAWIEIKLLKSLRELGEGRTPRWVRGLK